MLGKVLKYDLKNIFKFIIVFYILGLFFSVFAKIFLNIEGSFVINIIGQVFSGATIAMIFNILINNLMRSWVKFKLNFYGDESYLTHTLPVKKETLYMSKMLTALISVFASIIVIVATLFIAYYSSELFDIVKMYLEIMASSANTSVLIMILAFVFIFFLEIVNAIQAGYTGIILGHKMNNNKTGMSILFGFITYIFTQVFVLLVVFVIALFNNNLMSLFTSSDVISTSAMKTAVALYIGIYTAILIIVYFVNTALLKKGVDVE